MRQASGPDKSTRQVMYFSYALGAVAFALFVLGLAIFPLSRGQPLWTFAPPAVAFGMMALSFVLYRRRTRAATIR